MSNQQKCLLKARILNYTLLYFLQSLLQPMAVGESHSQPVVEILLSIGVLEMKDDVFDERDYFFVLLALEEFLDEVVLFLEEVVVYAD